jgi:hypothetical protein
VLEIACFDCWPRTEISFRNLKNPPRVAVIVFGMHMARLHWFYLSRGFKHV